MKKTFFYLLIAILGYACNDSTPCKCWKYSYYSTHKNNCDEAARKMGLEKWDNEEHGCQDYRLKEDKDAGYTKLDKVVVKDPQYGYIWQEVYVKE